MKTTYVSLSGCAVRAGARVERGTPLGTSDGSGDHSSSSPHLHFGAALNGVAVDPVMLLEGRLLDPSRDLFLGPWGDQQSLEALIQGPSGDQGLTGSVKAGLSAIGRGVASAAGSCWDGLAAAAKWVGGGCAGFYRACIEPWAGGFVGKVGDACRAVVSNHYVQALVAGLLAAVVIAAAVLLIGLTFGIATPLVITAIVAGSLAAIGFAEYYAYAAGEYFSFTQCLTESLIVGGVVALGVICLGQSWTLISSGFSKVGLLGFAKSFLVHGLADSLSYAVINSIAGRPFNWKTFALTFVLGGLAGGTGKAFVTGLSQNLLRGLSAGSFAAGQMGSESFYVLKTSLTLLKDGGFAALARAGAYQMGTAMAEKLTYMAFCGCTSFLAEFSLRLASGASFGLGESLLSFGTGFFMGGVGVSSATLSPARILSNAACVYKPMGTEFLKNYVKKTATKGGKELIGSRYGGAEKSGWELLPSQGVRAGFSGPDQTDSVLI